jgi:proline iminopeptidase
LGAQNLRPYNAKKYPVKVPVTYFQGSDDTATVASGAYRHYTSVPIGAKQWMLLQHGGHNPSLTNIRLGDSVQTQVFEHAVRGEKIPKALLEQLSSSQELKWLYSVENF